MVDPMDRNGDTHIINYRGLVTHGYEWTIRRIVIKRNKRRDKQRLSRIKTKPKCYFLRRTHVIIISNQVIFILYISGDINEINSNYNKGAAHHTICRKDSHIMLKVQRTAIALPPLLYVGTTR